MLELLLLLRTQLVGVLEEFHQLLLCQLNVSAIGFALGTILPLRLDLVLITFFIHLLLLLLILLLLFLFSILLHGLLLLHLLLLSFDEELLLLIDLLI